MSSSQALNPGKGIGLYLLGVFFFACNDALGKWLVTGYSVGEILLLRAAGAVPLLIMVALVTRVSLKLHGQWPLHIIRVLCLCGDSFSFYYATRSMPLADVMTYYMAAPLIITALSFFLLGERVRLFRWTAVIVGFVGVIIALQPTGAAFAPAAVVALIGATLFGLSIVITRKLSGAHWLPLVTWQFVGAGLIGAGLSGFDWVTPGAVDLFLMFLVGIVSAFCFILITRALAMAPASLLAPFQYSAILWAALLGWIIWHDAPTMHIVIGNCVIIGSGLVIFYRESRIKVTVSRERVEPIP